VCMAARKSNSRIFASNQRSSARLDMPNIGLYLFSLLLVCISSTDAQIIDTFDNQQTTEGWTTSFFSTSGPFTTPTSTGGVALSHGTNGQNKLDIAHLGNSLLYFEAPSRYLGDDSLSYNKFLSFDLGDEQMTSPKMSGPDIVLVGNGLTLVLDIPQDPPNSAVNLGHFDVTLAPSTMWHISTLTGLEPTTAQFQSVLSSVTALRIRGSFSQNGVASIDNIVLAPEPSSIILCLLGLVALALPLCKRSPAISQVMGSWFRARRSEPFSG